MRALRTLIGLVLVLAGVPTVLLGAAGWFALQHSDGDGSFVAQVGPVRTSGYAVIVPDVTTLADRHGAASLLGANSLRLTVHSDREPVRLWIVPADQLSRYLDGVARTEVSAVGYATGPQPVNLTDISGFRTPGPMPFADTAASGYSLAWEKSTDAQTSLLLVRADGRPDLEATLAVQVYATWLPASAWTALGMGTVVLLAGIAVLFWPVRPRPPMLVVEADQLVELADAIAERMAGPPLPIHRVREVTGELVPIPRPALSSYVDTAT
jgi:hypothetical protein